MDPVGTKPYLVHSRPRAERYLDIKPSVTPWLVKAVLPATGVAFLVGASRAGKSFLALDWGLRIASGAKVLGKTTRRCGVAYIGAEDAEGCRTRIAAWRHEFRRTSDTPFDFYGEPVNLLDPDEVDEMSDALAESSRSFAELGFPLGLVILDTLSCCIPGAEENSSKDMSLAFLQLKKIGLRTRSLVLVCAHFGKSGEERGIRGWSGMDAHSDATVTLERDAEDPDLRTLKLQKVKNGRDGGEASFRLANVDLGLADDDGDPITSCVVRYESTPPSKSAKSHKKAMNVPEQLVYRALVKLTDRGSHQDFPPTILNIKPWMKAIRRTDLTVQLLGDGFAYDGESDGSTRKRLSRAIQGLAAQQRLRTESDLVWLT